MSTKPSDGNIGPTHNQCHQRHHKCHDSIYFDGRVGIVFIGFIKAIGFIPGLIESSNDPHSSQSFTEDQIQTVSFFLHAFEKWHSKIHDSTNQNDHNWNND